MSEQLEVPIHVLVRRIRLEIGDNMDALNLSIGMGEHASAQEYAERIKVLLGVLDALLADGEGIYT
jgi:hypothetical protein